MVFHHPQQLLWGLDIFCLHMAWLKRSHLTYIDQSQCWIRVHKDQHWLLSIWTFWSVVADFFVGETIVFTLQLDNFLPSESGGFATSKARRGRVQRHRRGTAVHGVGWMLITIGWLAHGFCACVCVCVCPSVLVTTKVSCWCSEFDVLQILIG